MYSLITYLLVGGIGIIIGSFANVLIARHQTGVGIGGRSRCLSCSHTLTVAELIPVVSFLLQRGRCRSCDTPISWQYPIVELLCGLYAVLILSMPIALPIMVLYWIAGVPLIVIAVYDTIHFIIPLLYARLLLAVAVVFTALSIYSPLLAVQPHTIATAFALMLFFYSLWLFSDGRAMGFGDVGLVLSLGLLVPYPANIAGAVFSFWLGAVLGIYLLWRSKSHRTLKSEVPFGPFLVAGFVLALAVHAFVPELLYIL